MFIIQASKKNACCSKMLRHLGVIQLVCKSKRKLSTSHDSNASKINSEILPCFKNTALSKTVNNFKKYFSFKAKTV